MSRRPVAPPPKPRSGTARTVILVAVAAVLAGLIIGRGLSNNSSSGAGPTTAGGGTKTTKADGKATTTVGTPAPTTPTTVAVNLGAFRAVVLNGNGIPGTAGARTTELNALGVQVAKAADAVSKDFAASSFYAVDAASEPAARLLAAKTGIKYEGGYPTANPPAAVDKLGGATIVLLLGKDVANKVITDTGATAAAATPTTVAGAAAGATTTVKA
jgi:LytR cell envelope-related transcriptional attenuator